MDIIQLQDYFARIPPESLFSFFLNMALAIGLTWILSIMYVRYGRTFSDRRNLARTFILIAVTTMLVITVIKSSLALSLGLVGALSIVRFRAAIKDPEELAYLFLTIGIGLGLGAAARRTTILTCLVVFFIIWYRARQEHAQAHPNLSLVISRAAPLTDGLTLSKLIEIVKKHCRRVDLIRFEESDRQLEASLHVECRAYQQLEALRDDLRKIDTGLNIMFLDLGAGKTF